MPNDFAHVARKFCDDPPDWIAAELTRFAKFVSGPDDRRTRGDLLDDVTLIVALDKVQTELAIYLDPDYHLIDDDEVVDAFNALDQAVYVVLEYLKSELRPLRGKQADGRRYMCAAICDRIWTKVHGKRKPYSTKLYAAIEEYWLACHPESGASSGIDWEKVLTRPQPPGI